MVTRIEESLVAKCDAICNLKGDLAKKAVFSAVEINEKGEGNAVYYCGLGKKDCVIAHYGQRFNEVAKRAYAAREQALAGPARFRG